MDQNGDAPFGPESPAINLSPGPRRDSTGDSNGSIRDEAESIGLSDDDLEEFLKNAENLSDQTPGGLCLYDCSISSDLQKSLSQTNYTLNDVSESNITRHIHDLSCSLAVEGERCLSLPHEEDVDNTVDLIGSAVIIKDGIIKELCSVLSEANEQQLKKAKSAKELMSQVSWIKENAVSNLSICSLEEKRDDNTNSSSLENFRLSSYIRAIASQNVGSQSLSSESTREPMKTENKSMQTSPLPVEVAVPASQVQFQFSKEVAALCLNFLSATKSLKEEMLVVRQLIRQPYQNHDDFPIQKILSCLQEISKSHESEITNYKQQLSSETKHHHEVQNTLKTEIKTLKMRFQDKIKQRDGEIAELRARIVETDEIPEQGNDAESPRGDAIETPGRPPLDDSFQSYHSMSDEETFSNLLSRTKMEYLKLTPSEYVEDEVIDTVHIPDAFRQLLEDYKLKLFDMEKKFDSNKRYLEEQTHDREVERDEFQHTLSTLQQQIEELKRENAKLYEVNKQHVFQIEEYAGRLKNAEEDEMEMVQRHETTERELKAAVEKIYELRDIIRDLENQVDAMSSNAIQLKEQNQVLLDELEKIEMTNKKEQPVFKEQDSYGTIPLDVTDEIQTQLQELARRIEGKLNEKDSFLVQTRPNSSCSGVASAISTEDISCREVAGRSSRNFENFPIEDFGSVILNEIRRLESQFESFLRLDDVMLKKLKDSELRCSVQAAKVLEIENQISIYQEKCAKQALKIADLEGSVDALRFDTTNQSLISSLKSRLQVTSKQLEEYRNMYAKRELEISQIKEELRSVQIKQLERRMEHKEIQVVLPEQQSQTFESSSRFAELTFEGVSPEKIRRMESTNPLSTSVVSVQRNILKEAHIMPSVPDLQLTKDFEQDEEGSHFQNRSGMNAALSGGGDGRSATKGTSYDISSVPHNIEEMDKLLHELQRLLKEKDKAIQSLENKLKKKEGSQVLDKKSGPGQIGDEKCEQEGVTIDMNLNPNLNQVPSKRKSEKQLKATGPVSPAAGEPYVYEATYSSDYAVEGDLLKYIGTKLIHEGPRRANSLDYGQSRVAETEGQIKIATLNIEIQQLKRALEEERKKSDNLSRQLKSCEESKAELRSRSPLTRAPVQNVASSASVTTRQLENQHRELIHQIEEGRNLLNEKHKQIRVLQDQVHGLETKLCSKAELEQELRTRLNSISALLRKCEEHGRELTASNQDQVKEIRRLRGQVDKMNNRNNEVCHVTTNSTDHVESYLRAKSFRKALAWQKKYLTSVILGYKSILRQVGHGAEHPELLQIQIPLAPSAVGLLERCKGRAKFRLIVFTVLAVIRMKYMVNRWSKKRPGEGSPDSEYKSSKHTIRVDPTAAVIRPPRSILVQNRVNHSTQPLVGNDARGENVDTISEYISRFESIENEISSSLSRNLFPS